MLRDASGETVREAMSRHTKELMDHVPYVRRLALHGISVDNALGLPFHLDAAYLDQVHGQRFAGRLSYFPFPGHLGLCDYSFEPAFIRKRNERERHRVRCVNEGYARLREHLPQEFEDKRLSKVETLRAAIDYIKHLQGLLELNASGVEMSLGDAHSHASVPQRTECNSDGESKTSLSDCGEAVY
ncbi:achaete-scute homolog 4-like [Polymixia lowei]